MIIAANLLQTIATAAKPWASLYSDSTAVSSAVTFFIWADFCSPADSPSRQTAPRSERCAEPMKIGAACSLISAMRTHGCWRGCR